MSETMRDAKIDWIQSVLGLDLRVARADAGQDRPTAGDDAPKRHASGRKPKRKQEMVAAPILGSMQQKRAEALKAALSPADRKTFDALIEKSKTDKEKQYVTKGLAAGHTVAELTRFQARIAGKDDKWMQDHLKLTGDSKGKGIKQQWHMSCNATTAQAVKGELDPLYALRLHDENSDISKADDNNAAAMNTKMGAEQKTMLESANPDGSQGGEASNRSDPTPKRGRWNTDLLNTMQDTTGLKYASKKLGGGITIDTAIAAMKGDAAQGIPLPIVIGNGPAQYTHYVLVTACQPGPPAKFAIHDPWEGKTYMRSEATIRAGTINIAGSNQITAYENPSVVSPS